MGGQFVALTWGYVHGQISLHYYYCKVQVCPLTTFYGKLTKYFAYVSDVTVFTTAVKGVIFVVWYTCSTITARRRVTRSLKQINKAKTQTKTKNKKTV